MDFEEALKESYQQQDILGLVNWLLGLVFILALFFYFGLDKFEFCDEYSMPYFITSYFPCTSLSIPTGGYAPSGGLLLIFLIIRSMLLWQGWRKIFKV